MAVDDLAAADPLPRVLAWLSGHPAVIDVLGGTGRVGGENVPPYPRLLLTDPDGDDRDLRWLLAPVIQIEALDDLDGSAGKARLRRCLYVALGALKQLPDQEVPPGEPVITEVRGVRGGGWVPLPTGQGRYVASVRVWSHRGP